MIGTQCVHDCLQWLQIIQKPSTNPLLTGLETNLIFLGPSPRFASYRPILLTALLPSRLERSIAQTSFNLEVILSHFLCKFNFILNNTIVEMQ